MIKTAHAHLKEYFGCFDRSGIFLGTDASEYWTAEQFFNFSYPHFIGKKSAWVYTPIPNTRKIIYIPNGDSPNFATFDELLTSDSFGATARGSGCLVLKDSEHY